MSLPEPTADAREHSGRLVTLIATEIAAAGGWIPFSRFMDLALYAPGLGYYAAGARKFGAGGDFVTAPELTPLFARALANQVAQVMAASAPRLLEAGAGSGRLAADLLTALAARDALPDEYLILEVSADLAARQRETLAAAVPDLLPRVRWLDCLPERFDGCVIGNEVLDAMPVDLVAWRRDGIFEHGVGVDVESGGFVWTERPAAGRLLETASALAAETGIPPDYVSEIGLAASAWAAEWGRIIGRGAVLLLDYGFPRREFYHPQRATGTLMCHYRHHAHPDPFYLPGLQDITAHVDFTAVIEAAHGAGLELYGYAPQGQFLINCGLLDALMTLPPDGTAYFRGAAMIHKLIQPQEMGELFKAIAFGRGIAEPLLGFGRGDRSASL